MKIFQEKITTSLLLKGKKDLDLNLKKKVKKSIEIKHKKR